MTESWTETDLVNVSGQAARSIGGNGRRTSHNPPDPSMLDIYDRVGVVVMDENRDCECSRGRSLSPSSEA